MDELVSARARAGVLARSLFKTELTVEIERRAKALRFRGIDRIEKSNVSREPGAKESADPKFPRLLCPAFAVFP